MYCRIVASTQADQSLAASLASRFDLSLASASDKPELHTTPSFTLVVSRGRISLTDAKSGRALITDEPPRLYQVRRSDLLGRAVGGSRSHNRRVVDATAGFGGDAIQLAMMGFSVHCVERCAVAAILLEARVAQLPGAVRERLSCEFGNAVEALGTVTGVDVVYLDPMYPPKRRASALPPLEMQVLRQLVGDDLDIRALFDRAREVAEQRVVVKRPLYAPPIEDKPQGQHTGKLVRFDIYPKART